MRRNLFGFGVMLLILPSLCLLAAGQDKAAKPKAPPVSKQIETMRRAADTNARALATAVEARAIEKGIYDNVLSSYDRDMGGFIPINPCTGTRTGYTMSVSKDLKKAAVAAMAGTKCGKWKPEVFKLTL